MTTTYDDMATAIADEVADSALTSQIQLCIAEARRKYDRKRLYFNQQTGTFATVASQEYYGTAANADIPNLLAIDDMKILIDTATYPLSPMDFGMMDGIQTGVVTADPVSYAYFDLQIRLYPIPANVRTITMAYFYRAAAPVFGTSVADVWTNNAYDLIRTASTRILHQRYTKEDGEVQRLTPIEADAYSDLRAETRQRLSNGILRTDVPQHRTRFNIYTGR